MTTNLLHPVLQFLMELPMLLNEEGWFLGGPERDATEPCG